MFVQRRQTVARVRPKPLRRRGATIVEMAVVIPVFAIFMAGLMEVNHAYLTLNILKAAVNKGARLGVAEPTTNAQVEAKVREVLGSAIDEDAVSVIIKDASVFDSPNVNPNNINYGSLPDINLQNAEPRQLFIVRVEVDYDKVALLPPMFVKKTGPNGQKQSVKMTAQAVMRHE